MLVMKKNGEKVWVTFTVSSIDPIEGITLLGEWNTWEGEPMKKKKNGDYYLTKVLNTGKSFEFGYMVNGEQWLTEDACSSVPSPFGSQNSLLEL